MSRRSRTVRRPAPSPVPFELRFVCGFALAALLWCAFVFGCQAASADAAAVAEMDAAVHARTMDALAAKGPLY